MVPISICTSEDPKCSKLKVLLDRPDTTITLSGVSPDQWVKVRWPATLFASDAEEIGQRLEKYSELSQLEDVELM